MKLTLFPLLLVPFFLPPYLSWLHFWAQYLGMDCWWLQSSKFLEDDWACPPWMRQINKKQLVKILSNREVKIKCVYTRSISKSLNFTKLYRVSPVTLPKIVCLFCSSCVAPSVKKNWDSLSLFPELAVATNPLRTNLNLEWTSFFKKNKKDQY